MSSNISGSTQQTQNVSDLLDEQETPAPGAPLAPKGLAITALIIGIIALLTALIPVLGLILGVLGLTFGIVALVKKQAKGFAVTGTVLSAIAAIVSIAATLFLGIFATAVFDGISEEFGTSDLMDTSVSAKLPAGSNSAAVGTREDPFPAGTIISTSDWDVVVNSVKLDATEDIVDANPFNEPAAVGFQYALANVTVTYQGEDSDFPFTVGIDYVAADGSVMSAWETAVVTPEPSFGTGELYAGASATGNIAFTIPETADGLLRVTPGLFADEVFIQVQ